MGKCRPHHHCHHLPPPAIPSFHHKCRPAKSAAPGHCPPAPTPCRVPACVSAISVFFEVIKPISNFNVFNNIKITLHYSVYMRASGEKVRVSDEAERVESVSYSHIRSLSGPYTVVCLREGKRGTCLRPSFTTVMCKVPCPQRGPAATVMYKWSTLLSKGSPTAVVICKYLAFKGAQSNCDA